MMKLYLMISRTARCGTGKMDAAEVNSKAGSWSLERLRSGSATLGFFPGRSEEMGGEEHGR